MNQVYLMMGLAESFGRSFGFTEKQIRIIRDSRCQIMGEIAAMIANRGINAECLLRFGGLYYDDDKVPYEEWILIREFVYTGELIRLYCHIQFKVITLPNDFSYIQPHLEIDSYKPFNIYTDDEYRRSSDGWIPDMGGRFKISELKLLPQCFLY